jgi:hypothetical protein
MKKNQFYKDKYLIGIYSSIEEGEQLMFLCDNAKEFAKLMEISNRAAYVILKKLFDKKTNFIRFFGKICYVEFIDFVNVN